MKVGDRVRLYERAPKFSCSDGWGHDFAALVGREGVVLEHADCGCWKVKLGDTLVFVSRENLVPVNNCCNRRLPKPS